MLRGQCEVTDNRPSTILDPRVGKNPLSDPEEGGAGGADLGPSVLGEPEVCVLPTVWTTENRAETRCQNSYQQDVTDRKTLGE